MGITPPPYSHPRVWAASKCLNFYNDKLHTTYRYCHGNYLNCCYGILELLWGWLNYEIDIQLQQLLPEYYIYLHFFLFLSLSLSLFVSLSLVLSLFRSLSFSLSLSFFLSLSLSLFLYLSLSLCLSLFLCLSLSLFVSFSFSLLHPMINITVTGVRDMLKFHPAMALYWCPVKGEWWIKGLH